MICYTPEKKRDFAINENFPWDFETARGFSNYFISVTGI